MLAAPRRATIQASESPYATIRTPRCHAYFTMCDCAAWTGWRHRRKRSAGSKRSRLAFHAISRRQHASLYSTQERRCGRPPSCSQRMRSTSTRTSSRRADGDARPLDCDVAQTVAIVGPARWSGGHADAGQPAREPPIAEIPHSSPQRHARTERPRNGARPRGAQEGRGAVLLYGDEDRRRQRAGIVPLRARSAERAGFEPAVRF